MIKCFSDFEPRPFFLKNETSIADLIGGEYSDLEESTWNGLFFISADQKNLMARIRVPGGRLKSNQLREIGNIARELTTGYIQITTRCNFQIRFIDAKYAKDLTKRLQDIHLHKVGEGANNVRNLSCSPFAGIIPEEKIDIFPLVLEWARQVTNDKGLKNLPTKFNMTFYGVGENPKIESTNDISVVAIRSNQKNLYRIILGGSKNGDLGLKIDEDELIRVLSAVVKVYINHKYLSQRRKTRLKGVLENWNLESFLVETTKLYGGKLHKSETLNEHDVLGIPPPRIGLFPNSKPNLINLGVPTDMGSLNAKQLIVLADVAKLYGDDEIRLTRWQNIIIPGLRRDKLLHIHKKLEDSGLSTKQSHIKSSMVSCTGSQYCPYSESDTKKHAAELAEYLESRVELDVPINIHLTGCSNSCAQHYIGDIGLLATSLRSGNENQPAYHVFVGGSFGKRKSHGRHLYKALTINKLKIRIESMLKFYTKMKKRNETFQEFTSRFETDRLILMFQSPRKITNNVKA